jgi:very-short-patch-repair endonuclease
MGDKGRTHHELAALAERQHGVVAARQLVALGYSRNAIAHAKALGRLRHIRRGVYAVGHRPATWHSRCLAAVLSRGSNAVASHRAAAWIWGLIGHRPDSLDVTVPVRRRHANPDLRPHYAALVDADLDVREGIPVTAVPRTLLDLSTILKPQRLDAAIERSEELRLFDLPAVDDLLSRVRSHPGAGRLRRALDLYRPPPFTRSGLERRFLELVRRERLPTPATGHNVAGYELDVYWEPERFAVELDVYETHGSRRSFERDRVRQEELKLHGVEMIRVTGPRLGREPDLVMRRVTALLAQRRRQLAVWR